MTHSNASSEQRRTASPRPKHDAPVFEEWMLQLLLVAGTVAAMIQGVWSLSGGL